MNHPSHPSHFVEYEVHASYMQVVADDGGQFPGYAARPRLGERFPAIVLLHDWWGLNAAVRMVAIRLARAGFYVVAPDLFDGKHAANAREAAALVEEMARQRRFSRVIESLDVLEKHQHSTRRVAVAGIGLGGGLAFRAAIQHPHREAAVVAFSGFPQTYSGKFGSCPVPICAVYGSADPLISQTMIERLRGELASSALRDQHRVVVIDGAAHDLFPDDPSDAEREYGTRALAQAIGFLQEHLRPTEGGAR
jgi:carboxymethylenebutenolidase